MSDTLQKEEQIKASINAAFRSAKVSIQRKGRIIVEFRGGILPAFASYLKEYLNFKHLSMISGVDWPEDNQFELVYHLWSYEQSIHVMVKVRLDREAAKTKTLTPLWEHAETYEREIHEMLGVEFEGHPNMRDFILEDWDDLPPMRRDFMTREYVDEVYEWRKGREDAQDVRQTIAEQYNTEVPNFNNEDK